MVVNRQWSRVRLWSRRGCRRSPVDCKLVERLWRHSRIVDALRQKRKTVALHTDLGPGPVDVFSVHPLRGNRAGCADRVLGLGGVACCYLVDKVSLIYRMIKRHRITIPLRDIVGADFCLQLPYWLVNVGWWRNHGNLHVSQEVLVATEVQIKLVFLKNWQEVASNLDVVNLLVVERVDWVMLNGSFPDDVGILIPQCERFLYPCVLRVAPCYPLRIVALELVKANQLRVSKRSLLQLLGSIIRAKHQD